jgi:hypothetical protein
MGGFSGKYHVVSTSHSVDPQGGYTTDAELYKIL